MTGPRTHGFTLVELMFTVVIAVFLAAVALPTFWRYGRYARSAEAIHMLDLVKKGSAAYYSVSSLEALTHRGRESCVFPKSVAVTPHGRGCCSNEPTRRKGGNHYGWAKGAPHWGAEDKTVPAMPGADSDGDGRCDPNPLFWNQATWVALHFELNTPHLFQYEYASQGKKRAARFQAMAYGDLDCDGDLSTFQLVGSGDRHATDEGCDQVTASALYSDRETE